MIRKLLIANRGEIACRVIRTARRLGVATVAVYSEADAKALHVEMADEAYPIGPPPARESYLRIDALIEACRASGADAVHPGYGFLSENAGFADALAEAGITFVGPPASAIQAMGGKSEAKALMGQAGVPLIPGYHGEDQSEATLKWQAENIGFPVLVKASAGGGGKGMRVVETADGFEAALASAKREAASSFGDDRVLIEKYLGRPRHVEIQVFADTHGTALYLSERDCSLQRRHQKVVEEAPAPGLAPEIRRRMGEAAVAAAKAIDYVGAGTVEFLLDTDGSFYFMEMNTRLQVEHPVTEMITGLDLVEWQLRVASGEPLPLGQDDVELVGHAVEVRLYAEDPASGFLPQTGTLARLVFAEGDGHVRIDTGVREGDAISIHYDPMIAKVITWDHDRRRALARMAGALDRIRVAGLKTNLDFLGAIARHPAFAPSEGEPELDTKFIDRHLAALLPSASGADDATLVLATLGWLAERERESEAAAARSTDPGSPWADRHGWRLNLAGEETLVLAEADGREEPIAVVVTHGRDGRYRVTVPSGHQATGRGEVDAAGTLVAEIDGVRRRARCIVQGDEIQIAHAGGPTHRVQRVDPLADAEGGADGGRLTSPMPGRVVSVLVEAGQAVERGQPLLVLEAMKMEHTIKAPADGTIAHLPYAAGDQVEADADLIGFETA